MRTQFAITISLLAAIALPLPAAADGIQSFLADHKKRSSVWNLECFQGGRKITAAAKLRIGRYKGKNGAQNQFADEHGRQVRILASPGTACVDRQVSGPRIRAAAPRKGGLQLLQPKGN